MAVLALRWEDHAAIGEGTPTGPRPRRGNVAGMRALADLHRHLDGSLREQTLRELAAAAGVEVPGALRFTPGMGLDGALARFRVTVASLQRPDALRRVAAESCEDAAASGVTTLELRFAPQLHDAMPIEAAIEAVLEGLAGRAGLILCALYGEAPGSVEALVRAAAGAARRGVVGIDLAGGPAPAHAFRLSDYAAPFRLAAELGLGRTVHAGEGRPPSEIRTAIEELGAQRIGHGTTLLDDPGVLDLVRDRGVAIEACVTSNLHTGVIRRIADHPLPRWLALGVRACICTDNTLFSEIDAVEEHARARAIPGMTDELLAQAIAHGHAAAFSTRGRGEAVEDLA
jgi:adenosine deaminase